MLMRQYGDGKKNPKVDLSGDYIHISTKTRRIDVKKIILTVLGVLLGVFGIAQALQLMGLIGTKQFSIAGVAFTILGLALAASCFKKAFKTQ